MCCFFIWPFEAHEKILTWRENSSYITGNRPRVYWYPHILIQSGMVHGVFLLTQGEYLPASHSDKYIGLKSLRGMWWTCRWKWVKRLSQVVVLRCDESRGPGPIQSDLVWLRTVVCCRSCCLWPAADSLSSSWLLTCMMNVSSLFIQTHPSGICLLAQLDVGGGLRFHAVCSLLSHTLENKMLKCSSCFDLETKPHCKSKHELAWPRSPLLTSGLDSKPSRCGSQFGEATLQMVPAFSIKTFIWKKFLTATERKKRREIPWSRPFSNPCGGKAIREQLRDGGTGGWLTSVLTFTQKVNRLAERHSLAHYCMNSLWNWLKISPSAS